MTLTVSGGAGTGRRSRRRRHAVRRRARRSSTAQGLRGAAPGRSQRDRRQGPRHPHRPAGGDRRTEGLDRAGRSCRPASSRSPIPDVAGLDARRRVATARPSRASPCASVTEPSTQRQHGQRDRTDPPAGTKATRGATVRMFVSSGARAGRRCPNVTRPDAGRRASRRSSDKGFDVSSVITEVDDANVGKVIDQIPSRRHAACPGQQRRAHGRRSRARDDHHDDHDAAPDPDRSRDAPRSRAGTRAHGRHDLPWRATRDRWAVLVSEVMLHQTQVPRVLGAWSTRSWRSSPTPARDGGRGPGAR